MGTLGVDALERRLVGVRVEDRVADAHLGHAHCDAREAMPPYVEKIVAHGPHDSPRPRAFLPA